MVIPAGFEPTACRLGGDRSILLSYGTMSLKSLFYKAFREVSVLLTEGRNLTFPR